MGRHLGGMAWALVLAPLALAAPATAQDFSAGKRVDTPDVARSLEGADGPAKGVRSAAPQRSSETSRGFPGASAAPSFRMIGRSHDGTERVIEPSERVIEALKGVRKAEQSRDVIGRDGRSQVQDTTTYPNITVGFLQTANAEPKIGLSCTAAMIGPRIAVTAARCVYDHDVEGGWLETARFWPALNGEAFIPFGQAEWEDMYILEDFIKAYDGSYDSVWPYDIAVIIFEEPIGEETVGWLGYDSFGDVDSLDFTLTGYGDGREPWRQYDSTCKVQKADIRELDILHACDADYMSAGAPMYLYDAEEDSYTVVALHQGLLGTRNWALRLTEPLALWIDDLNWR